jgi:hypothetical protein
MGKARPLTEEQWLTDDLFLLSQLQRHVRIANEPDGPRRLRLFACGCCRRAWHLFTDERERRLVEFAERAADGRAARRELADAEAEAAALASERQAPFLGPPRPGWSPEWCEEVARQMLAYAVQAAASTRLAWYAGGPAMAVASALSHWAARHAPERQFDLQQEEMRTNAALARDLFGNPFRAPPAIDPAWRAWKGGTVGRLAQSIYVEGRFDHLPVLADALEEAGCTDADILDHFRRPGIHARGCWLIDLLRGMVQA